MNKKLVLKFVGENSGEIYKTSKTIGQISSTAEDTNLVQFAKAFAKFVEPDLKEAQKITTESLAI